MPIINHMMLPRTPVAGRMELLDLHIGCVQMGEDKPLAVAIMLQAGHLLLTDDKSGYLLHNWKDVAEVVEGLLVEARRAFGPPPDSADAPPA